MYLPCVMKVKHGSQKVGQCWQWYGIKLEHMDGILKHETECFQGFESKILDCVGFCVGGTNEWML